MALLCLTCHQPIPEGKEYPRFFGQHNLSPDLTTPDHAYEELTVVLGYLRGYTARRMALRRR